MVKESFNGDTRYYRLQYEADNDSIEVVGDDGDEINGVVYNHDQNTIVCTGKFNNGSEVTVKYDKAKDMKYSEKENENQEENNDEEDD